MIRDWCARRPRCRGHVTPMFASWRNQVERFFAMLTDRQSRRGVHRSTGELEQAIKDYIKTVNEAPKPFSWNKTADDIRASIQRCCRSTHEAPDANTSRHYQLRNQNTRQVQEVHIRNVDVVTRWLQVI